MLDFDLATRISQDGSPPVRSVHFRFAGEALLPLLVARSDGPADRIDPLALGWDLLNANSLPLLLLESRPVELASGRVPIYVCPTCADLACGTYACRIERVDDDVVWRDFAWETVWDPADPIPDVGPFAMPASDYTAMIRSAWALLSAGSTPEMS